MLTQLQLKSLQLCPPSLPPPQKTHRLTTRVRRSSRTEPSALSQVLAQSEAGLSVAPEGVGTGHLKVIPLPYPLRVSFMIWWHAGDDNLSSKEQPL